MSRLQSVRRAKVLGLLLVAACGYDASFTDCAIRCAMDGECPGDLQCGPEGLCRSITATAPCTVAIPDASTTGAVPPSCDGLPATCGSIRADDCCSTATAIPGGSFFRSHDVSTDGKFPDETHPATVSAFRLDKYEVTVGRVRRFMKAGNGTRQHPPAAGAGAHAKISGSGWDPIWDMTLTVDEDTLRAAVKCDPARTWTDTPGTNEELPMNCLTWYEAAAFCSWDGGYLPTEAEWNFAAAGGAEQRAYPWSIPPASTAIDCSHANYAGCVSDVDRVGARAPIGDGKWGQSDLAGNALEWVLDEAAEPYPTTTCDDCANLLPATGRILRGGSVLYDVTYQRTALRKALVPTSRFADVGFRCARN